MAENPNPFTCDICGVHKGEQNHWFRVWKDEADGLVVIAPWGFDVEAAEHFHCCGEQHAVQKAAELLTPSGGRSNRELGEG